MKVRCPGCGSSEMRALSEGLFLCKKCLLSLNKNHRSLPYDDAYFLQDYKNQYGKTYIEDFNNIYNSSRLRLTRIFNFHNYDPAKINILELGSAMGIFLKCCKDSGISNLQGIEISAYASRYCITEYGIPTIPDSFDNVKIKDTFDVIAAWYFIEHMNDPVSAFKRIYLLLNPDGVFACSLPSLFGPDFSFNRDRWIKNHPVDHSVDFSPRSIKIILRRIGFRKIKIFPSGYHPERIIPVRSFLYKPFSFFYKIFSTLSGYSDTMEVYALK